MQYAHVFWSSRDCQPPSGSQQGSFLLTVGRLVPTSHTEYVVRAVSDDLWRYARTAHIISPSLVFTFSCCLSWSLVASLWDDQAMCRGDLVCSDWEACEAFTWGSTSAQTYVTTVTPALTLRAPVFAMVWWWVVFAEPSVISRFRSGTRTVTSLSTRIQSGWLCSHSN